MEEMKIDARDEQILRLLQQDARIPNNRLAELVALSPPACHRRVRALEEAGVIRQYTTVLDAVKLGRGLTMFVEVKLGNQNKQAVDAFEREVQAFAEVSECHLIAGEFDYLLRVVVADHNAYQRFLWDRLTVTPGVANVRSLLSMRTVKDMPGVTV